MALKMALSSVKAAVCVPGALVRPRASTGVFQAACAKTTCVISQGQLPITKPVAMPFFPLMPMRLLMLKAASTAADPLSPEYEAYVQGDEDLTALSPCVLCQTALLMLNEKGVEFTRHFVDFRNPPSWLREAVGSAMPAVRDMGARPRRWLAGLDDISSYLEQHHPVPPLGTLADSPAPVDIDGLWRAFRDYLESPTSDADTSLALLTDRLRDIKERLGVNGGPYLAGEDVTAFDLALAPRLHHILSALPALKMQPGLVGQEYMVLQSWRLPPELAALQDYAAALRGRDSWADTAPPVEDIVRHWRGHLNRMALNRPVAEAI